MRQARFPYVMVEWNDAHGDGDEYSEATLKHQPMVYRSPGWLVKSDEAGVSLFVEWCVTDDTYRGHTFVPRAMIVSETPLKFARARKPKVTT